MYSTRRSMYIDSFLFRYFIHSLHSTTTTRRFLRSNQITLNRDLAVAWDSVPASYSSVFVYERLILLCMKLSQLRCSQYLTNNAEKFIVSLVENGWKLYIKCELHTRNATFSTSCIHFFHNKVSKFTLNREQIYLHTDVSTLSCEK